MTKAAELREMSNEQLEFSLKEVQDRWFRLRVQSTTEKLDVPSNIQKTRREIARIKTILRERVLSSGNS